MRTSKRLPSRDDTVVIESYGPARWKVLDVADGMAHLSMLFSFERLDYRDVPVERLTVIEGVLT